MDDVSEFWHELGIAGRDPFREAHRANASVQLSVMFAFQNFSAPLHPLLALPRNGHSSQEVAPACE